MAGERDEMGGYTLRAGNPEVLFECRGSLEEMGSQEINRFKTIQVEVTHRVQTRIIAGHPILDTYHLRLKHSPERVFAIVNKTNGGNRNRVYNMVVKETPLKL